MKRIALTVVSLVTTVLLAATAYAAAAAPGSQVITRRVNGMTESRLLTVDPAVPGSENPLDVLSRGGNALDETGQMIWETSHPSGLMDNVAISDDGSVVAISVTLNEFQLQVYNGVTGQMTYSKSGGNQWINSVAVSGSGDEIVYTSGMNMFLMSPADSIPVWTANMTPDTLANVAISKNGNHIVLTQAQTTQDQDSLHVWGFDSNLDTPIWSVAYAAAPLGGWTGISFSSDGMLVAVTSRYRIFVLNSLTGEQIWSVEANNTEHPAKLSNDGHVLTTGSNGGTFRVFGWDNGQQTYLQLWRYSFTGGTSNWATASAVSGDGLTVACGSLQFTATGYNGFVAVFDTYGSGQPLWLSPTMYDMVSDVEISDNGLTIVGTSWGDINNVANPNIMVFDKYDATPFFTYAHPGSPNDVAMNPAGTKIFAGGKAVHNRQFGNGGHAYLFAADLEGGTVSGTVTITGQTNRSGVTVEAVGLHRTATTDSAGVYHIYNVPAGSTTIRAHKLGYTSPTTMVMVQEGGNHTNVNFTLVAVEAAPSGFHASQGLLTHVHLTWDAMALWTMGGRDREHEMRVTAGDEPLGAQRGPVARGAATNAGWQHGRGSTLDDPDSIRVWRSAVQGGPYTALGAVAGTAMSFDDSARVFPGTNYYYVATAVYANGESVFLDEALGTVDQSYLLHNVTVPAAIRPVDFDGVLSPDEWGDALKIDVSDVYGYDVPNAPHSVFLYLKYDAANYQLYVAAEDHNQSTLEDNEGFGIYVDDDNSRTWTYANAGSEGNYWAYYFASGSTLRYRSLTGDPYGATPYQFTDPQLGFSVASGFFTGEVAIPVGADQPFEINVPSPNMISGIGFFVTDRANGGLNFDAWWPQDVPSVVSNPEAFAECTIPATPAVPPLPPSGIAVVNQGAALHVTWTDPILGVDSAGLQLPLSGVKLYRNGTLLTTLAPGVETYTDNAVVAGGRYDYQLTGFLTVEAADYEGPQSLWVGEYAGTGPGPLQLLAWDDGSAEQYAYVHYPYWGNRIAEYFTMPHAHSVVYDVQIKTSGTGPLALGIASDNAGTPGAQVAGPYWFTPPVSEQYFTFHIPAMDPPTVVPNFWVTVDWDSNSPDNPGVGTDTDGPRNNRSWSYTSGGGWAQQLWANWIIRADVGGAEQGVSDGNSPVVHGFRLMSNYPNPFNPNTTIPFELAETGAASVTIYNLMGQKVATLLSGMQQAGYHLVQWNGQTDLGASVSSGVYLVRLEAGPKVATQKIALIR